jgi:hypothetical protein
MRLAIERNEASEATAGDPFVNVIAVDGFAEGTKNPRVARSVGSLRARCEYPGLMTAVA